MSSGGDRPEIVDLRALLERPGPGPHRTSTRIGEEEVETLADLPPERGGLLFVGLNPSPVSVTAGHYHQGTLGRRFWSRLGQAGILPPGAPAESADDALVAAGHGITDLLKRPTARDTASDADLTAGVGPLWQKIAIWRPWPSSRARCRCGARRCRPAPSPRWPLRKSGRLRKPALRRPGARRKHA
jgi:hypothetical protein